MSDFVVHKGRRAPGRFARSFGSDVVRVTFNSGGPTSVVLSDGRVGAGSCLGCGSAPCMEKETNELALYGALDAFPGDPSLEVCPTGAIRWEGANASAMVLAAECIGCGLCVSRCPYGAINLADGLAARVETTDPNGLIIAGEFEGEHSMPESGGVIANLDAPAARMLPEKIGALEDSQTNLLVRNLLSEIGLRARTRRRGDTNVRMDAVGYSRSERPFVAEIETGGEVLESPRALLEDIAVLHSRYGYVVADIDPVSILLALPSTRSEYYQVIRDIERVLGLQCRTVTVGALIALLWNGARIDGFANGAFAMREEKIDLTNHLGIEAARTIEPYPGAFRPAK